MITAISPVTGQTVCAACGNPISAGHAPDCPVPSNRWAMVGDCDACGHPLDGEAALEPAVGFVHPECTREGA